MKHTVSKELDKINLHLALDPDLVKLERSRVERTIDQIAQEWVLAHNSVKNGVLTNDKSHNAHLYIELEK